MAGWHGCVVRRLDGRNFISNIDRPRAIYATIIMSSTDGVVERTVPLKLHCVTNDVIVIVIGAVARCLIYCC